eukprot:m.744988 g.744988  ORF g.744988 m.744988 type:complete len:64 (+) comp58953_c1_seq42:69-260(+)
MIARATRSSLSESLRDAFITVVDFDETDARASSRRKGIKISTDGKRNLNKSGDSNPRIRLLDD